MKDIYPWQRNDWARLQELRSVRCMVCCSRNKGIGKLIWR